jgi:hypothetical protein
MVEWAAGELVFSDVSSRILFDDYHDTDGDELSVTYTIMNETMVEKGFTVVELNPGQGPITSTLLEDYGILFILDAETALSTDEIAAVHSFISEGKALLYVGELAFGHNPYTMSDTLSTYGIQATDLDFMETNITDFATHPITQGVSKIELIDGWGTLVVSSPSVSIALDPDYGAPVMAVYQGSGKVVALQDSSLWKDPSGIGNEQHS